MGVHHTSAWRAMSVPLQLRRKLCSLLAVNVGVSGCTCCRSCIQTQASLAALQDPGHLAGADLFSDISALSAASSSRTPPSAGPSHSTHSKQQDSTASALVTELHDSSWTLSAGQAASTNVAAASSSLGLQTQPAQALEAAFAAAQAQHHLSVTMELQVTSPAVSTLCLVCQPQLLYAEHLSTSASSQLPAPVPSAPTIWCLPRFCMLLTDVGKHSSPLL